MTKLFGFLGELGRGRFLVRLRLLTLRAFYSCLFSFLFLGLGDLGFLGAWFLKGSQRRFLCVLILLLFYGRLILARVLFLGILGESRLLFFRILGLEDMVLHLGNLLFLSLLPKLLDFDRLLGLFFCRRLVMLLVLGLADFRLAFCSVVLCCCRRSFLGSGDIRLRLRGRLRIESRVLF